MLHYTTIPGPAGARSTTSPSVKCSEPSCGWCGEWSAAMLEEEALAARARRGEVVTIDADPAEFVRVGGLFCPLCYAPAELVLPTAATRETPGSVEICPTCLHVIGWSGQHYVIVWSGQHSCQEVEAAVPAGASL